jgi:hypothetical protein
VEHIGKEKQIKDQGQKKKESVWEMPKPRGHWDVMTPRIHVLEMERQQTDEDCTCSYCACKQNSKMHMKRCKPA